MKSLNLFTRIFTVVVFLTLGSLSLAGYSAKKAYESDPELLSKLEKSFNIHISNGSFIMSGMPWDDSNRAINQDSWRMPLTDKQVTIKTRSGRVSIKTTSSKDISISATGSLDKTRAPRLLEIESVNAELAINEPQNGVDNLEVRIEIPNSFTQDISVLSLTGDVTVENLSANIINVTTTSGEIIMNAIKADAVNLASISGDTEVREASITTLNGKSVSGEIKIDSRSTAMAKLKSISGDIRLKLPVNDSYKFTLKTTSGDIKNIHVDRQESVANIQISTVSGDIDIN